jgi:hypothetical protein
MLRMSSACQQQASTWTIESLALSATPMPRGAFFPSANLSPSQRVTFLCFRRKAMTNSTSNISTYVQKSRAAKHIVGEHGGAVSWRMLPRHRLSCTPTVSHTPCLTLSTGKQSQVQSRSCSIYFLKRIDTRAPRLHAPVQKLYM